MIYLIINYCYHIIKPFQIKYFLDALFYFHYSLLSFHYFYVYLPFSASLNNSALNTYYFVLYHILSTVSICLWKWIISLVTVQPSIHYIHKTCQQLLYIKNNIVMDCCQPLLRSFCFIHYVNERLFYHINNR